MPNKIKTMYIFIDLVCLLILLLIRLDFGMLTQKRNDFNERLFNGLILITSVIIFTDILTYICNLNSEIIFINYLVNAIHFSSQPILTSAWLMYVDYKLYSDKNKTQKMIPYLAIPCIIISILAFLSYWHPIFFGITDDGVYYRADYFIHFSAINMLYFVYSSYEVIKRIMSTSSRLDRKKYRILLIYPIFPFVGVLLQSLAYGVNSIWLLTVVSFLVIYFNLQNSQLTTDTLTHLNNRYSFDNYIENKLLNKLGGKKLFLIMIDIDKFKSINDNFGHLEGDHALVLVSKLIAAGIHKDDFLARLGGDEFVVVGERKTEKEIINTIDNINKEVDNQNKKQREKYRISLSIGYSYSSDSNMKSRDDLIKDADAMMYKNKQLSINNAL